MISAKLAATLMAQIANQRVASRRGERNVRTGRLVPVKDVPQRIGRNDPCPCGSGKKLKNCHYDQVVRGHEIQAGE